MPRLSSLCLLVSALVLVGCNQAPRGTVRVEDSDPTKREVATNEGGPGQPMSSEAQPVEPGNPTTDGHEQPTPGAPSNPGKISEIENPTIERPEIKPVGTDGWIALAQTPEEFGQTVDRAISSLSNVAGTFNIELRNESMEGSKSGQFLIASSAQYAIDTVDIDKPTVLNRTLANGSTKKSLSENGWTAPQAVSAQGKPVGQKVSNTLSRNFSRLMFESLTERRPTWSPVLKSLEAEGFRVTLETKSISTSGVMRPYTRLVATRDGVGLNEFEVRFDGIRHVPLTVRMVSTAASGKPVTSEWRGKWKFNQKVSDEIAKL